MKKNHIASLLFIAGLVSFLIPGSLRLTGNIIVENVFIIFNLFHIIGLIFLSSSLILFMKKALESEEDPMIKAVKGIKKYVVNLIPKK
jgi:TM2 domain-containing membrane protein YozV|tara:strand:+ start:2639 stop:2902 length:264 start_codon:yes stop_codon:yes gene_type:complete